MHQHSAGLFNDLRLESEVDDDKLSEEIKRFRLERILERLLLIGEGFVYWLQVQCTLAMLLFDCIGITLLSRK